MKKRPPAWLYRRPRILNLLHLLRLASPDSQMIGEEADCLSRHAHGKKLALEIGTYMGVTAAIIAESLASDAKLFCIDPFGKKIDKQKPRLSIATRNLKRKNVFNKIKFLIGLSTEKEIADEIPAGLDFILVDGDHSYDGLKNDWQIVLNKLAPSGIVCLHDTTIPEKEPYRIFGSVKYFDDIIRQDKNFEFIETAYSMNVLRKK